MADFMANQLHLVRRFIKSLSRTSPSSSDIAWVNECLLPGEFELWLRMESYDQRHSIEVARRFTNLHREFTRDQVAAALLHDIGKVHSKLGPVCQWMIAQMAERLLFTWQTRVQIPAPALYEITL